MAGGAKLPAPILLAAISGFGANPAPVLTLGTGFMNPAAAIVFDGTGLRELDIGVGAITFIGAIGIGLAGIGAGVDGVTAGGVGAGGRTTGSGVFIGAGGFTASTALTGAGFGASSLAVFISVFGCDFAAEGAVSPCLVRTGNSFR